MANFTLATPMNFYDGIKDLSTRKVLPRKKPKPLHLPLIYVFPQKGGGRAYVDGSEALIKFGGKTFDPRSKYFNHASLLAVTNFANGGLAMMEGLESRTGRKANLYLYAYTVTNDKMLNYQRDAFGIVNKNEKGSTPLTGYDIGFFVVHTEDSNFDPTVITELETKIYPDDGSDPVTVTTNNVYPIMSMKGPFKREWYNNIGFSLKALIDNELDEKLKDKEKTLAYEFTLFNKETGSNILVENIYSGTTTKFTFKPDVVHPITNRELYAETVIPFMYHNEEDINLPIVEKTFDEFTVYKDSLKNFVYSLIGIEKTNLSNLGLNIYYPELFVSDDASDDAYMINFTSFKNIENNYYESLRPATADITVTTRTLPEGLIYSRVDLSNNTPVFMDKGFDGDLSNEEFESLVLERVAEYANKNSVLQKLAINPENVFYDSGFRFITKLALDKLIYLRNDMIPILGTYSTEAGRKTGDELVDEISKAALLKQRFSIISDSKLYGTPNSRTHILEGSGVVSDDTYKERIPTTIELCAKYARYLGSEEGIPKTEYAFSRQPNNIIKGLKAIYPNNIPNGIKNKLWVTGMTWTEVNDINERFFETVQTIYPDDTSVLNVSEYTFYISHYVKFLDYLHRKYVGANDLSDNELKDLIEADIRDDAAKRFKNIVIVPEVYYLEEDKLMGTVWRTKITFYGNNAKTVQVSHIETRRLSDLG